MIITCFAPSGGTHATHNISTVNNILHYYRFTSLSVISRKPLSQSCHSPIRWNGYNPFLKLFRQLHHPQCFKRFNNLFFHSAHILLHLTLAAATELSPNWIFKQWSSKKRLRLPFYVLTKRYCSLLKRLPSNIWQFHREWKYYSPDI